MQPERADTLDQVPPGRTVTLAGFSAALDAAFRDQLLAYGLEPNQCFKVLQQAPMTIVMCDHVELALERAVARLIEVRALTPVA